MWNRKFAGPLALALMMAGLMAASPVPAARSDKESVEQAAGQFYRALNTMFTGDARPMIDVWSHADDVTYMGPGGGLQVGWERVLALWEAQAAMKLGGKVEPADTQIVVGDDLAVTYSYEIGENTNADGQTESVSIRATNVFRKENGQWKMIGHHTDLLPFLAN